jgi:hypothetical protein
MDALDERLRASMKALDERAPAAASGDLAARVLVRLDDDGGTTEGRMDTTTTDAPRAGGAPPPPATTEDSGLHDIKALARTTRQRVSRRNTSQHDIDESLLSASSSGLHAVALPEPARLVALPTLQQVIDKAEAPAVARAAAAVARRPEPARRRTPLVWIAGGVVAAAAAVAVVVVTTGGKKVADRQGAVAGSGSGSAVAAMGSDQGSAAATDTPAAVTAVPAAAAGSGSAAGAPGAAPTGGMGSDQGVGGSGSAAVADNAVAATGTAAGGDVADGGKLAAADDTATRPPAEHEDRAEATGHDRHAAPHHHGTTTSHATSKPDRASGHGAKPRHKPGEKKSLDDLISEAAGGPDSLVQPKQEAAAAKPSKKELTPRDVRAGMDSVKKRAQACYDKLGVTGTVPIKAVVAPSGKISSVVAKGSFAGTPTGACVAAAVEHAGFPAWDGPPMTINYSFFLSD